MRQTCIDYAPFLYKHKDNEAILARQNQAAMRDLRQSVPDDQEFDKYACKLQPQIELLLGTETGTVCCYDPKLLERGTVIKYNN